MEVKRVFCCSCFIDQAQYFVDRLKFMWEFDPFLFKDFKICGNVFIYERMFNYKFVDDDVYYVTTLIVCCLDCFNFLVYDLSSVEETIFDKIDCDFVIEEAFCYDSYIYSGNDRFHFESSNSNVKSTKERVEEFFFKSPKKKSCYTSLAKTYYKYFCYTCKDLFMEVFLKKLHLISDDS